MNQLLPKSDSSVAPKSALVHEAYGLRVIKILYRKTAPFMVRFPKRAGSLGGRKYYSTLEAAKTAVAQYGSGKTVASLGKRATDDYLCATELLGDVPLIEAVRYYLAHKPKADIPFGEALDALERQVLKCSRAYTSASKRYLQRIRESIPSDTPLSTLTRAKLIKVIESYPTYWPQRAVYRLLVSVYRKAMMDGSVAYGPTPLDGWKLSASKPRTSISYLKASEVTDLLAWLKDNHPDYLPAFALQLYSGIRTEELCRPEEGGRRGLRWSDLTWGQYIDIEPSVSKTETGRRIAFWPAALSRWLDRPKDDGFIMPHSTYGNIKSRLVARFQKERMALGLPKIGWSQNVCRHTYASHLLALDGHSGRAESFMGHRGKAMLDNHYVNVKITKEEAEGYFGGDSNQ